ncbi:flagellin hook IN motif-containing protein [Pseudovibrio sp. POLY-S9]|uniref:flagellin N-terminal helical domain-containing protein n=1 Tax=Pseudovibrio sp. POLY-S9 TaxID=1576596 RepID=UPI00070D59B0|nr:flagellin hook IN motif-containing protein [Pseudovibrio sp. POLY-S9]
MADITLTAAVRSNLGTLQNTATLIADTQERLSTGKKVNSALDNPNSFFTASSLNSRASDLSNLQDDIGQSVSTLEAADKGIESIDKLLDAAKGKANQALQTQDTAERAKYAEEYNELRTQIEDIAKDSGYKGKNLLGGDGNDLTVKFNEDGSSDLQIGAVDYTDLDSEDANFKLDGIDATVKSQDAVAFSDNLVELGLGAEKFSDELDFGTASSSTAINTLDGIANGDVLSFNVGGATGSLDDVTITVDSTTTLGNIASTLNEQEGVQASITSDGKLKIASDEDIAFASTGVGTVWPAADTAQGTLDNSTVLADLDGFADRDSITISVDGGEAKNFDINATTTLGNLVSELNGNAGVNAQVHDNKLKIDSDTSDLEIKFLQGNGNNTAGADFGSSGGVDVLKDTQAQDQRAGSGWGDDGLIEDSLDQIRQAQLDLRAQASTFGTNLSVVSNRQDFTADLINTLEVGAGKLTLADSNLEGANLAALNTQNSIATSTLSLATQAGQSVLQLIR